jgi:hypothetical protein
MITPVPTFPHQGGRKFSAFDRGQISPPPRRGRCAETWSRGPGFRGCDQGGRVGALSRGPACGDATAKTRNAADSTDPGSCRNPFGGCAHKHAGKCGAASRSGGSAERGAGARLRDATVEPIKGASFQCRSHARLRGQIPRGAPLPPYDAPSKHDTLGTCSALRGRGVRGNDSPLFIGEGRPFYAPSP